jgi:hypothetical protein
MKVSNELIKDIKAFYICFKKAYTVLPGIAITFPPFLVNSSVI